MKSAYKFFFSIQLLLSVLIINAQGLLEKLESGADDVKDASGSAITIFWTYFNVLIIFLFLAWAIQAVRKSRAHSDDESGEGFSLPKFLAPRGAILLVLILIEVISKSLLG